MIPEIKSQLSNQSEHFFNAIKSDLETNGTNNTKVSIYYILSP